MATFIEPKAYDKDKVYSVGDFIVFKVEENNELSYFMNIHASRDDDISSNDWWQAASVQPGSPQ